MKIADDLLHGRLLPEISESESRNKLYVLGCTELNFDPSCKLIFDYPKVSCKVKLAKRQIDNAVNADLNNLVASLESNCTSSRVLYKLMTIKRTIRPALQNIQTHIDSGKYELKAFANKNARYGGIDRPFYESVYVCNYVQRILIWYALEFQSHFINFIPEEKRLSLDSIYIEYLQMPAPDESYIVPVQRINVTEQLEPNPERQIDLEIEVEKMPTKAQLFYNEVQKYNFRNLPKLQGLGSNKIEILITTMTAKDLPYAVAMLNYLEYYKYLKSNYDNMNKENFYKHIATALNIKSPRQVKGNFLVLRTNSS